ncbi:MAG: hypothetical protein JW809_04290 [Pirellulales bacterium]|nr:hypothetical protein [Pirellulales bacterium]
MPPSRQSTLKAATALVLLAAALAALPARAQTPAHSMIAQYAQRYFQLGVRSGRIVVTNTRRGSLNTQSSTNNQRKERLSIQSSNVSGGSEMLYELTSPAETLTIQLASEGRVRVSRAPKGDAPLPAVEFLQEPKGPLAFSVGTGPTWTAPTLWHLLFAHPAECQEHLIPFLKVFHPDGDLVAEARQVEAELLRLANNDAPPDRKRWEQLVAQLGADQYARREAADRELREAGRRVAPYLEGLDASALDAEQRFRIRRIVQAFSGAAGEDSAADAASMLIEDPALWLILLARSEVETRRTARQQLERLLGRSIDFDPEAEPDARSAQIAALRRQIESGAP